MAQYVVVRQSEDGRRFDRLLADPTEAELLAGAPLRWGAKGVDLGPTRSEEVARLVAGARAVRIGDAPPEETYDVEARQKERRRAERDKRIGDLASDPATFDRAHAALALMSPEERARWSAPDPVQDAAAEMERAARVPESMRR